MNPKTGALGNAFGRKGLRLWDVVKVQKEVWKVASVLRIITPGEISVLVD